MHFIIQLQITQTTRGLSTIVILFQHGQRIDTGQCIGVVLGDSIGFGSSFPSPVSVIPTTIIINRFGRIEKGRSGNRPAFGKTSLVNGTFNIDIDRQMVVKELRTQVKGSCITTIMGSTQRTFLIIETQRCTERQETHFTGYTDILVGSQSHVEDLVLPIGRLFGILANHGSCCITQSCSRWILLGYCPTEFISFHYLYPLVRVLHGIGTGIVHFDSVLTPLLGRNDNHPIRSPRAEDGRCRSVLQYGESFNIIRVDSCQGIGSSWCSIIGNRNAIDYNQRIVRGIQRSPTTDTQGTSGSRLSVAGRNI